MDSMRERQAESGTPDVYAKVYNAERPEAFFKATANRLAPPFTPVGIRADSEWDVPEPELAFVLFDGKIAGYTAGNDMSSRSIEGANPLYLPQAKVYDRSAAIGPCFATPEVVGDPQDLDVTLTIERGGEQAFQGKANTGSMKRDCAYLADWLQRHNPVPDGTTALTGTGTIPPPEFTLKDGDVVTIEIERIGALVNTVITV
jgi:2-dehydro-3-deoxy-D-arabinonate dehydratase